MTIDDVPTSTVSLTSLRPGERATISHVTGEDAVAARLGHLGFLPGTVVETVRRAPFGDPTVYQLRGNQMCLRKAESNRIVLRDESST